jgi:hypothetical protein
VRNTRDLTPVARIDHIAEHFLEILEFIKRSAVSGLEDTPEVQALRAAVDEQRTRAVGLTKAQRSAALRQVKEMEQQLGDVLSQLAGADEAPPEWLIDGIRKWISVFTPGRITLRAYPNEDEPAFHLVANLKRESFVDADLGNLLLAYGTRPTVKLTVLGLVTSVPAESGHPFDPMGEYPPEAEAMAEAAEEAGTDIGSESDGETDAERVASFERAFRKLFRAFEGMEQFGRATRYPRVTIYPIAIYRRVPVDAST